MVQNNGFNPKRLRDARIIRQLTMNELAEMIGVTKQAISQFELGTAVPKAENMMALVNTLQFPKAFFHNDSEKQHVGNTFFRAQSSLTKKSRDLQLIKAQWVADIQTYLERYVDFPKPNLPDLAIFDGCKWGNSTVESLANHVRNHWRLGDKPIGNMMNLLEMHGILVSTIDVGHEKLDAFCQVRQGEKPLIIFSNDKPSAVRRHFSGAHELGHLLMHITEIDDQDCLSSDEFKLMESQADHFASAFLLPEEAFRKTVLSTSLDYFVELKKYWKVSIGAMIRRCRDLGIINESKYVSLNKQISMKKYRKKEPLDDVFPVPEPTALRNAITLLLEHGIKDEIQIANEIGLPIYFVESLCSLAPGTLSTRERDPETIVRFKIIPKLG